MATAVLEVTAVIPDINVAPAVIDGTAELIGDREIPNKQRAGA